MKPAPLLTMRDRILLALCGVILVFGALESSWLLLNAYFEAAAFVGLMLVGVPMLLWTPRKKDDAP